MIWFLVFLVIASNVMALSWFRAAKSANEKVSVMGEYVQFLFFQEKVYSDHRQKFLAFVAESRESDPVAHAISTGSSIEVMAQSLGDKTLLSNVLSRSGAEGA